MRLALGERVAGDDAAAACIETELGKQRHGQPAGLCWSPRPSAGLPARDGRERLSNPAKRRVWTVERRAVEIQESRSQGFVALRLDFAESEPDQSRRTVRNQRADAVETAAIRGLRRRGRD